MANQKPLRVFYLDASLRNNAGHFATNCRILKNALTEFGVPMIIMAHFGIEPVLAKEFSASGLFRQSPYAQTSQDPLCGWFKSFLDVADMFEADFAGISGITVKDQIHYDTPTPAVMLGLIRWIQKKFAPDDCPRISLSLSEYSGVAKGLKDDGSTEYQLINQDAALYRYAASCIRPDYLDRFHFLCADRDEFRAAYAHVLNLNVQGIPHPIAAVTGENSMPDLQRLCVGFIGAHRPGHGFEAVGKIVKILAEKHRNLRFIVQDSRQQLKHEKEDLSETARQLPDQVEIIDRPLDSSEWAALLQRCNMLVAPYDAYLYSACPSGVAIEAIANGIPLVITKGTGMECIFSRYAMPARRVENYSVAGFVEGIEDVLGQYETIFEGAQKARHSWAQENGGQHMARALLFLD